MAEETSPLVKNVIFILVTLAFFVVMFLAVRRAATEDSAYEQAYAKEIALLVDRAKPNTEIKLNALELIYRARKNKAEPKVEIGNNLVSVKITEGKGYSFQHFSGYKIVYGLDRQNKVLIIKIIDAK